jgi:hypothetical protein
MPLHEMGYFAPARRTPTPNCSWVVRVTKRPIHQHPLSVLPLNDANLMAGLHAGDRVDMKPTEQGGRVESL